MPVVMASLVTTVPFSASARYQPSVSTRSNVST
jgi:hypothetical protein